MVEFFCRISKSCDTWGSFDLVCSVFIDLWKSWLEVFSKRYFSELDCWNQFSFVFIGLFSSNPQESSAAATSTLNYLIFQDPNLQRFNQLFSGVDSIAPWINLKVSGDATSSTLIFP